jgi:hypothetical protein
LFERPNDFGGTRDGHCHDDRHRYRLHSSAHLPTFAVHSGRLCFHQTQCRHQCPRVTVTPRLERDAGVHREQHY